MKQSIGMQGIINARELGGYRTADGRTVKGGKLLRTARLSRATEEDLARLCELYRLGTVIDFRMDEEIAEDPDPDLEGVRHCIYPILEEDQFTSREQELVSYLGKPVAEAGRWDLLLASVKAGIISHDMYRVFLGSEIGKLGYRHFFEELLALPEDRSILFHCTQGKDRTGLAAFLILTALGVDEETIIADYMLTNAYCESRIEEELAHLARILPPGEDPGDYMIIMDQVSETTIRRGIAYVKEEYGSVLAYIRQELGVGDVQLAALREKFLTG